MRREDLHKLAEPYGDREGSDVNYRLARRLGVYVASAIALEQDVFEDLDEEKFGVGWWAPHPGTKRRILISDYLWQCCHSIQQNLTEAALHLLEARGAWGEHAERLSRGLWIDRGGDPKFEMPEIATPLDELSGELFRLHVGGFMRAVGSTLDCLGGVVVAMAGLKTDLLKADLDSAFRAMDKLTAPATDGERLQRELGVELRAAIERSGPQGWLRWATQYRNMLIHRGRRTQKGGGVLVASPILDARGGRVPRLRSFPLLPRDPSRSDVEVMLHLEAYDHLTEHGLRTLGGILESTLAFTAAAVTHLRAVWKQRRAAPSLIVQPREQWRDIKTTAHPFCGYEDGTIGTGFTQMHVAPTAVRRLRAAALTSDLRHLWDAFD